MHWPDFWCSRLAGLGCPPRIPINDQVALEDALYHTFQVTWDHAAIAAWAQQRSWRTVAADVLAEFSRIVAAETREPVVF